jgi:hypothetical protein
MLELTVPRIKRNSAEIVVTPIIPVFISLPPKRLTD